MFENFYFIIGIHMCVTDICFVKEIKQRILRKIMINRGFMEGVDFGVKGFVC